MNVCIVGAGMAGLCAAKNCIENGMKVKVFEQNDQVGGTWVYTDEVGLDKFGNEIHTSMYKGLMTNLPKEIMGFPDFPIPDQKNSYVPAEDILKFINLYADNYKLKKYIQFQHNVIRIRPKTNRKWEVIVKDLPNAKFTTHEFDFVFVCNGHNNTPLMPKYPGQTIYTGKQLHSHDYRDPESFRDDKVLIIGAGPSGLDLALQLLKYNDKITVSHHSREKLNIPDTIIQKPDVLKLTKDGVEFLDGTTDNFSVILYCTGYRYSFNCLSMDCDIYVDDNYVKWLYKQCININYPTMAFIGLCNHAHEGYLMDLQIRFVLQYFLGKKTLPSKVDMMKSMKADMQLRFDKGYKNQQAHSLHDFCELYYEDLASTADIERIPLVQVKLFKVAGCKTFLGDLTRFREKNFKIIDNETFVVE